MKRSTGYSFGFLFVLSLILSSSQARQRLECLDEDDEPFEVNNSEVLEWKRTTANQYHDRAYVSGRLVRIYQSPDDHVHFQVRMGQGTKDTLEVVYNDDFGDLPSLQAGMNVQACGDYITASKPSGPYPASPDGALVHWVHKSTQPENHPSGFLRIDGVYYGQDVGDVKPSGSWKK